ncbi:phosphatase PAP2 family protein [Paraburkholderia sp. GAS334]|jgi:membrane-associated phospholipid phosphatase|uniref:phosphatase PAP2 family protein n=1 Tax=Paraburkholderia sp. GAS334 TaxID=3035131 RepID=UPI003D1EBDD9
MMRLLLYLTNFGDPYVTAPLAVIVVVWLGTTRSWRLLLTWVACFSAGVFVVAACRFAHRGWGMQLSALHITMVSGHTMLASAVYPTIFVICGSHATRRTTARAFLFGLAVALAIGVSRRLIGFHSTAEVATGWLIGSLIAGMTCWPLMATRSSEPHTTLRRYDPTPFAAIALALIVVCHGKIAPVSIWIDRTAPELSEWTKAQADEMH